MKVLRDNYSTKPYVKPTKIKCEHCCSEFEYEESDIEIGQLGCAYVKCPLCGYENYLEDERYELRLTPNNLEFPKHFYRFCKDKDSKEISNESSDYYYAGTGDTLVIVFKMDGDESYSVIVCKDRYETDIPFEEIDYR